MDKKSAIRSSKRQEVQGLRAISALLIAVFHIFQLGVSGGVDIFLVVSGFFLWGSARRLLESGSGFLEYYNKFFQRTAPEAILVVIVVLLFSTVFISPIEWIAVLRDGAFSAVYLQNYWLGVTGQDYLASSEGMSLFQHYWAISVIAQVHLLFPAFVLLALLCVKRTGFDRLQTFRTIIAVASLISFVWSIYLSQTNPVIAYYDTFTRIWQFGLGALLASYGTEKTSESALGNLLSWCGLLAFLSCGLLLRNAFPGIASLWPTLGALLILKYARETGGLRNAGALLSNRVLVRIGSMTFGIYLWHFPIFALYQRHTQEQTILSATLIILAAIALSWLSTGFLAWVGSAFRNGRFPRYGLTVTAVTAIIVTCVSSLALERILVLHPARLAEWRHPISRAPLTILRVREDLAEVYDLGCHQDQVTDAVVSCEFGPDDARARIFLVGGSHSAQWQPPLRQITDDLDLKLVSMTKSSCRFFSTEAEGMDAYLSESCRTWNDRVMERIAAETPEFLVALVDSSFEATPSGIAHALNKVLDMGVTVIALRDTPYMKIDVPACISQPLLSDPERCPRPWADVLDDEDYKLARSRVAEDVQIVDLNSIICPNGICNVVQDGMIMWRDSNHLTATYAKTLSDALFGQIGSTLVTH
ncbi:acyltransferase family protein [Salipiger sp. 1_MG-2023]|uniref:acyltransferase family protein n=1 Tax=Salipiger sp. 1_MG-2023 TaxID=3062665 RepID=UPI0026E1A7AF|nr:acyltransferase family protein [Salipiger sp. 1_MG-2023]MDO6588427.1 acyltransferase family protein [Salipiger sp. 1_MG-2023]